MNGNFISERNKIVILYVIIFLGLILRLYHIDYKSLWYDELASLSFSNRNLIEIFISQTDVPHPPVYYAILHFFLYLDNNELVLRFPSAIFGVACIPLVYALGKDFFNFQTGLLSAFLVAISPPLIARSQEARMYSLFVFLCILSLFFFYHSFRDNDLKFWVGLAGVNLFNIYIHYFAFIAIFAEFVFLAIYFKKYKLIFKKFVYISIFVLILFIPQLVNFYYGIINKMGEGSTWKWGLAPDLSFIPSILISFSSIKLPYEMATITMYQNIFNGNLDRWLAMIIILLIFSLGTFSSLTINKEATILSLSWIGIFILTAFLAAFRISIAEKYILPILPIYLIIVSVGLFHIKQKSSRLFVALIILILIFNSYYLYYYYSADSTVEDWRSASLYIQENLYHNDKIIITPSYTITGFTYYGLDQEMIVDLDAYRLKEDAPVKKISEMSSAKERLWIPYMPGFTTPSSDPDHALFRWLAQNCTKKYETEGIIIYLYDTHSKILYDDPIFIKSNLNSSEPFMILGTGWHGIENWSGVPTHWMKSDASLIINSLENRTYDLSLNARSFQRNRYLEIYLGDALRAVYLINPSDFAALTLPLYLSNGSNVVRFHIPDGCDCPCDMPELNSTDPRCLSLAMQNISCRRLE